MIKRYNRRQFISSVGGALGAAAGVSLIPLLACTRGKENARPNIIILLPDDLGWHDVGYHGSEINTPTIDRMAAQGVEFDQFYVYPTCSPTRASLLTGRPPSRFGIFTPVGGPSARALPRDVVTLAGLLRRNGYDTAITGKWHLGEKPEVGPLQYGFRYSYGYFHGQIDPYTHRYKFGNITWHRNDEYIDEEGHATDLITREAIKFITDIRDKQKPFFLYVPFSVPHYPLQEEDKWVRPYKDSIDNESRRLFAASVTHMDDSIAQILAVLEKEKIAKNTLVIFISDNGGQKQWLSTEDKYGGRYAPNDRLGDNHPLRGWKAQVYEGGIRVPAIFYWPGKLKHQKVEQSLVVYDIYPTVAHLAGAEISPDLHIEGVDFWPVLSGKKLKERVLYWRTPGQLAVRKGAWKLVHHGKTPDEGSDELYNLEIDPFEQRDVAGQYPRKVSELKSELRHQFSLDNSHRIDDL